MCVGVFVCVCDTNILELIFKTSLSSMRKLI